MLFEQNDFESAQDIFCVKNDIVADSVVALLQLHPVSLGDNLDAKDKIVYDYLIRFLQQYENEEMFASG